MSKNYEIPEILAPVGSVEAFYSAVHNGCDALYLGGHNFGARAYANNFSEEELKELVDYAHLYNVQVYYTINTIVKDIEIKTLHKELELLRLVNIDAVIIQDLGVYKYIKDNFSDLVIHGSTQMNLHSVKDVDLVKDLGFDRVVLSRECSLSDIRLIKDATGIEIEAFVHGALCYCYSGQCLMSSMYGGRSGNRGKCAQPCRMPYEVEGEAGYFLSPKDQMTLEILPDLIKAGVDSFKIEGRMKSAEYVGFASKIYKKYRDLSLKLIAKGQEESYKVNPLDIQKLNQLFNRGHFTEGYYKQHNDKNMISYTHGKNQGLLVGELTIDKSGFVFNFSQNINKEDLLEIHSDINLKIGETWPSIELNEEINIGIYKCTSLYNTKRERLNPNVFKSNSKILVYRIRDKKLLEELKTLTEIKNQIPLRLKVKGHLNEPLQLDIYNKDGQNLLVSLKGKEVEKALKRGMVEADFKKQLAKTKDTAFVFDNIDYDLDKDIFVPLGSINELRRRAIEAVKDSLLAQYLEEQKNRSNSLKDNMRDITLFTNKEKSFKDQEKAPYTISVRTEEQINAIAKLLSIPNIISQTKRIYIDITDINANGLNKALKELEQFKALEVFIALPHVIFEDYKKVLDKKLSEIDSNIYHGFLVRTLGQIQMANEMNKAFVTDYNLHTFNSLSLDEYIELGARSVTMSMELNQQGLEQIIRHNGDSCETVIYGSTSLMHSANCVYKTRRGLCNKKPLGHLLELEDRKGIKHKVQCHCDMCYNTIYNKHPLLILDETKDFEGTFRIDFTSEEYEETINIIKKIYNKTLKFDEDTTRGHFKKGVK